MNYCLEVLQQAHKHSAIIGRLALQLPNHRLYMHLLFKIIAKLYEVFLRTFRPISINYFCKIFPARHYPVPRGKPTNAHLDIFIPYRDKWDLTRLCLDSLTRQESSSFTLTVHLIDNGSCFQTQKYVDEWVSLNGHHIRALQYSVDEPFNFSKLCNIALKSAVAADRDSYYLFLNNDVLLNNSKTLALSLQFLQCNPDCGALGITLLYADQTIQHLFAAPGVKIIAAHPFKGRSTSILKEWDKMARRVPAITGAYLVISADRFRDLGGFDENLPTTGQDIDLCLKLQAKGWGVWVIPKIRALHLESASRRKSQINKAEVDYMYRKWQDKLVNHPEYPAGISRWSEQPVRKVALEGRYPYALNIKLC